MKAVIIIAIAVVCSVGLFFGLSFYDVDDIIKTQLTPFDCVETYDERYRLIETKDNQRFEDIIVNLEFELYENRCYATIGSWAYKSLYEDRIWGYSLEQYIGLNQEWFGEIDCKDAACEKSQAGMMNNREMMLKVLKAKGMQ